MVTVEWWRWNIIEKNNNDQNKIRNKTKRDKLTSLYQYLENNRERVTNYAKWYRQGKVISSQLAESTVESLINQRCKGKRHMQWSRLGLHPVLQLRSAAVSYDWAVNWEHYVMAAYKIAA